MLKIENWDRAMPRCSEDRLMLIETEHRVANEISAALAAMHFVRSAKGSKSRWAMLNDAIERLEGFAAVHRLLSSRPARVVDVAKDVGTLCGALAKARAGADGSKMHLHLPSTLVDGPSARRLTVIAAELVTNSIRYALQGRGGSLTVSISSVDSAVFLDVADDGPGFDPQSAAKGTGIGTPLIGELVHRAGGRIMRESGPDGTAIQVCLPFDSSCLGREREDG